MIKTDELIKLIREENLPKEIEAKARYDILDQVAEFLEKSGNAHTKEELLSIIEKLLPKAKKESIKAALNYIYSFAKKGIKREEYKGKEYLYYDAELKYKITRTNRIQELTESDEFMDFLEGLPKNR